MENKEQFNLNKTYSYFSDTIEKSVLNSVSSFFENKFKIFMASINDSLNPKENPILKNELFYTCQISIKNKQHIILRLSSDFIRIIFHDMFGSNYPVFDLEKLTELEQKILNSFFEYIVKNLNKYLISEAEITKINPLNKTELNFVFLIKNKEVDAGKLSIIIPLNRLIVKEVPVVQNFAYEDFINNFAYVDLIAGQSRISLEDLKNLSADDIIVLENSNIKTMTLKTETIEQEIKINPEPSIMLDMDDTDDDFGDIENNKYKEQYMPENNNMWDDIQIEINAEFKRVKMSLGDLKQISKGLVIDLGPVVNNEISLLVENKPVAKGELVIINDKYGVKITEVYASKNSEEKAQAAPKSLKPKQPAQAPKAQPQPQQVQQKPQPQPKQVPPRQPQAQPKAVENDDFDYSNFEE